MKSMYCSHVGYDLSATHRRLLRVAKLQLYVLEERIPGIVDGGDRKFATITSSMRYDGIVAAYSEEELVRIGDQFAKALVGPPPTIGSGIISRVRRAGRFLWQKIDDFLW